MNHDALDNPVSNAPRKVRFAPKAPRKDQKPVRPKAEKTEDAEAAQAEELLHRFNEATLKGKHKVEKKSHTRVAFGFGGGSSLRSFGASKGGTGITSSGGAYASGLKEYKEPWDYYTYYPVTLPMRRPYSGNPAILDEEEFGEDTTSTTYNEQLANAATDLGLVEENIEASMMFLQLPATLPLTKQSVKSEGQEMVSGSKPSKGSGKACGLDELPAGLMGKMLVYRSGAVKLKLGDTLYDVSPGLDCVFAQDVVAINTEEKQCCVIGELNKRATVTPDVDFVLDNIPDL